MKETEFRDLYKNRGIDKERTELAVKEVTLWEKYLIDKGKSMETAEIEDLRNYFAQIVLRGGNQEEAIFAIGKYLNLVKLNDLYIYVTSVVGGRTIYSSIAERLEKIAGSEARNKIFTGFESPPIGSPPEAYPAVTKRLMERIMSELPPNIWKRVLAGNHHRIPVSAFDKTKQWYEEASTMDEFLKKVHNEAVMELEEYLREGKIWYEQEITPEVVEFVRSNQEILSAVQKDGWLYETKIPYSPKDYISEKDPLMKRHYACHCPLARSAILRGEEVPHEWCYCSGGYHKSRLDYVFGEETEVELLESPLKGDMRCRFRIKIPESAKK